MSDLQSDTNYYKDFRINHSTLWRVTAWNNDMINVYIVEILGISELRIGNPNSKKHRIANPMQRKII